MKSFSRAAKAARDLGRKLGLWLIRSCNRKPKPGNGKGDMLDGIFSGPAYGKRKDRGDRARTYRVNRALGIPDVPTLGHMPRHS